MKIKTETNGNIIINTYKSSNMTDRRTAVEHGVSACHAVMLRNRLFRFYNGEENISKMMADVRNCNELVEKCFHSSATHLELSGYFEKYQFVIKVYFDTQEVTIEYNKNAEYFLPMVELFFLVTEPNA
jgi:hypothetical protein